MTLFKFGLFALALTMGPSYAQERFTLQDAELPEPGVAAAFPISAGVISVPRMDGLSPQRAALSLASLRPDAPLTTRGPRDVALYRSVAPSVALIVTNGGLGSGFVVKGGMIVTNWHVIKGFREVGVIYKPPAPRGTPKPSDVVRAAVIATDERRDLALLRPVSMPETAKPLEFAPTADLEVGADVHAIGHPTGEAWTYTKGIISQIRPAYVWRTGPGREHSATVVQTQTPINPGNSGGPLLAEDEKIVGINSFKSQGGEGLNFAVASSDIEAFLQRALTVSSNQAGQTQDGQTQVARASGDCQPRVLFEGRNKENTGFLRHVSLNCDGWPDLTFYAPDDVKQPFKAFFDTKKRKQPDIIVLDRSRSGKWEISFWDTDFDDTFPLVGRHPDGDLQPSSFEKRCPMGVAVKNFRCS